MVDRSRSMYSATLQKSSIINLRKACSKVKPSPRSSKSNQTNKATSIPTAFPTACFQVVATSVVASAGEGDNWGLGASSPTATTYYLTNGNGNSRLFRFIAIGH